ncbi:hypothetical protein RSOLAG1IB_00161 [Rhizoctonia solani AG-1 IB]|uniref:Uncharacterized protein n=1 Tax=Thanatephorus cucumeris (strain AG1-IB / isolate 7/3/14) TaxID=1108050 RepID=A0A0B7F0S8_THACB|nr:hypothetical protein RSOLAG1IB_00161 [Rhizoctonia solani AG-1 IB]
MKNNLISFQWKDQQPSAVTDEVLYCIVPVVHVGQGIQARNELKSTPKSSRDGFPRAFAPGYCAKVK